MAYKSSDPRGRHNWHRRKVIRGGNGGLRSLLLGLSLGAIGMFFFDPHRGRRRRALTRDKFVKLSHKIEWYVGKNYRNFRNHLKGWRAERRRKLKPESRVERRHANFGTGAYN